MTFNEGLKSCFEATFYGFETMTLNVTKISIKLIKSRLKTYLIIKAY